MAADFIINDQTKDEHLFPHDKGRGLELVGRPQGYAYGAVADPFPAELIIPRSEWQARIQEMEATKTRISDLCDLRGLKVKDQKQTNFCWANAPTHCTEIVRLLQNEAAVSLSPASVACRINGFRNQGGWGLEALKYIVANGIVPTSRWPDAAIARQYDTPDAERAGTAFKVAEWWELQPNNLDELMSALLRRYPLSCGLDWWGHQVTYVDPAWLDGEAAVRIDNSWGTSWGTNGRGILQGKKILPSDVTAPRTALAS